MNEKEKTYSETEKLIACQISIDYVMQGAEVLGAISYYIKNKELTLFIIIFSFMGGFMIFAMYFILEPMDKIFEFLDNIKIK